ncbi:MAG: hypothetical protein AB7V32_05495 [Candidatus Berkiella sp.]
MAHFPLNRIINNDDVIKICCRLYRQSVLKVLPISIALLLLYNFIRFGEYLYPEKYAHLHPQIAIFAVALLLPLIGALFSAIDAIGKTSTLSYSQLAIYTIQRFLPLAGCFFSMLLVPALILGVCAGVYFYLGMIEVNMLILFGWAGISSLIVFASFVPKVFAPILVFSDMLGANESIDESARLVKGNFLRCMLFCLLAGLVLFFFARLGYLITSYFPALKTLPRYMPEAIAQVLLAIIGPWSFALLLTLKYDLQIRHPLDASMRKVQKPVMKAPQSVSMPKKSDEDNVSF